MLWALPSRCATLLPWPPSLWVLPESPPNHSTTLPTPSYSLQWPLRRVSPDATEASLSKEIQYFSSARNSPITSHPRVEVFIMIPQAPEVWPQPSLWPQFLPFSLLHSVSAPKAMPRLPCFLFSLSLWTGEVDFANKNEVLGVGHQVSVWERHVKEGCVKSKPQPRHSCMTLMALAEFLYSSCGSFLELIPSPHSFVYHYPPLLGWCTTEELINVCWRSNDFVTI